MDYTQKERLALLRDLISKLKYNKISQYQLAKWLGISYGSISHWSQERRGVPAYLDHALDKIKVTLEEGKDLSTLKFPAKRDNKNIKKK